MHALVPGIAYLQPFRNLFRRPVQDQFTGHDRPQLLVVGKKAHLGSQSRLPGLTIGFTGSVEWTPALTRHLPAHCRRRPLQPVGYLPNRQAGSNPSRDVLPLGQRERSQRAPTSGRNYPAALRQQELNGPMVLAESAPNLMQRLTRLPTAPHVGSLLRGKPVPLSLCHKTPPLEK